VDRVREFFGFTNIGGDGTWLPSNGEAEYRTSVLSRDRSAFKASLLWLAGMSAITMDQMNRLDEIYAHRHDLTHEPAKYLVDPDFEPSIELLADALQILRDISRFWIQVEMDIGTFEEFGDIDIDEVVPAYVAMLEVCIKAYVEGLAD
jgi:hypothetical protein